MRKFNPYCILELERLRLGRFTAEEAPVMREHRGRREMADTNISIPKHYTEKNARRWIANTRGLGWALGSGYVVR